MDWKIFVSTFFLIFLAELGDKTQLAAMARATTSESAKWTVFAAASSALVLSTLIAVLFGSFLTKFIQPKHLKIAAAIMFIAFGCTMLWHTLAPGKSQQVKSSPAVGHFILKMAMDFEKSAFEDYQSMAQKAESPELRTLLEEISLEEGDHLKQVTAYADKSEVMFSSESDALQSEEHKHLKHDLSQDDRPLLEHAIEHETATANFYAELADLTVMPSLKQTFLALSKAELKHAEKLRSFGGISNDLKEGHRQ